MSKQTQIFVIDVLTKPYRKTINRVISSGMQISVCYSTINEFPSLALRCVDVVVPRIKIVMEYGRIYPILCGIWIYDWFPAESFMRFVPKIVSSWRKFVDVFKNQAVNIVFESYHKKMKLTFFLFACKIRLKWIVFS